MKKTIEITGDDIQISDGYHTFDELYEHRTILFLVLCNQLKSQAMNVWKSKKHSDGSEWKGWFIAGIGVNKGNQITYHIPIDKWDLCTSKELPKAPKYDGHSSQDVLERLQQL